VSDEVELGVHVFARGHRRVVAHRVDPVLKLIQSDGEARCASRIISVRLVSACLVAHTT
jgi:hypothetical protein